MITKTKCNITSALTVIAESFAKKAAKLSAACYADVMFPNH